MRLFERLHRFDPRRKLRLELEKVRSGANILAAERDAHLHQRDQSIGERNEFLHQRDVALGELNSLFQQGAPAEELRRREREARLNGAGQRQ